MPIAKLVKGNTNTKKQATSTVLEPGSLHHYQLDCMPSVPN